MSKNNKKEISILFIVTSIFKHIDRKSNSKLILFILSSIICGFLEIINLYSFSIILHFLSGDNVNLNKISLFLIEFISSLFNFNGSQLYSSIFIFLCITLITTFSRLYNLKLRFGTAASIGNHLSSKAYWLTINQPYYKFLDSNSSDQTIVLSRYIYDTVSLLNGLAAFVSSLMIIISIIFSLLFLNVYLTTTILALFLVSYFLIFSNQRNNLMGNSELIEKYSGLQIKNIQETVGSIKDIILYGSQKFEYSNYKKIDSKMRFAESRNFYLASAPRVIMEALALSFMSLIVLFLFLSGINESALITLVGSFALGAQRMLPAFNMVYSSLANIKGNAFSLLKVIEYLDRNIKVGNHSFANIEKINFEESITFNNVCYEYSSNPNKSILDNLNLKINKGDKIGIVGSTGSGKSTFLNILMTLLEPSKGELLIDGENINKSISKIQAWRNNIAHIPQFVYLSDVSIKQNITFQYPEDIDYELLKEVCEVSLVNEFINNFPFGLDTLVGERGIRFSGGQLQRLAIARALYRDGNVFVLDEATSSLDIKTEKKIIKNIENIPNKKTIITVAHRLETLQNCDYWIQINNGKVTKINNYEELYNLYQ